MLLTVLILLTAGIALTEGAPTDNVLPARFCTISNEEFAKCQAVKKNFADRNLSPGIECVKGIDAFDCMQLIERREADIYQYWALQAYVAGKFHHLVPFLRENSNAEPGWSLPHYTSAVVRKNDSSIKSLEDLRGKRSCHAGIFSIVGWDFPMAQFISRGLIKEGDCINAAANMASFFSKSCTAGANKPFWNAPNLCATCKGQGDDFCSIKDPFSGFNGAIRCLVEDGGDVAFVRHITFADIKEKEPELAKRLEEVELLCLDGTRKPLDKFKECSWGAIPDEVLMTSPELSQAQREAFRNMLFTAQQDQSSFKLFESSAYGGKNLLFSDQTKSLEDVGERNTYEKYLEDYMIVPPNQYPCSAEPVRWCTISTPEYRKCLRWRDSISYMLLRPEIECIQANNTNQCMKLIKDGKANAVDLDGGDIYEGGKDYNLQVIMNENSANGDAKYWAVAVVKKSNADITFQNLKGKKSCHTAIGRSAGWNVPVGVLLNSSQITKPADCNIAEAVGNFFSASCAPGALSPQFNPSGKNPQSLCSLCAGTGNDKCSRNENEPFYGYTGAFRCMATGIGDVAFVKHVTPIDNTDSHNQDAWAKDLHLNDFELLCKDGSRKSPNDYKSCNLAKIPAHAVVTGGSATNEQINKYLFLLNASQEFFAGPRNFGFNLFASGEGARDLLFTDSTKSVSALPVDKRPYKEYLGNIADVYDNINTCKQ